MIMVIIETVEKNITIIKFEKSYCWENYCRNK